MHLNANSYNDRIERNRAKLPTNSVDINIKALAELSAEKLGSVDKFHLSRNQIKLFEGIAVRLGNQEGTTKTSNIMGSRPTRAVAFCGGALIGGAGGAIAGGVIGSAVGTVGGPVGTVGGGIVVGAAAAAAAGTAAYGLSGYSSINTERSNLGRFRKEIIKQHRDFSELKSQIKDETEIQEDVDRCTESFKGAIRKNLETDINKLNIQLKGMDRKCMYMGKNVINEALAVIRDLNDIEIGFIEDKEFCTELTNIKEEMKKLVENTIDYKIDNVTIRKGYGFGDPRTPKMPRSVAVMKELQSRKETLMSIKKHFSDNVKKQEKKHAVEKQEKKHATSSKKPPVDVSKMQTNTDDDVSTEASELAPTDGPPNIHKTISLKAAIGKIIEQLDGRDDVMSKEIQNQLRGLKDPNHLESFISNVTDFELTHRDINYIYKGKGGGTFQTIKDGFEEGFPWTHYLKDMFNHYKNFENASNAEAEAINADSREYSPPKMVYSNIVQSMSPEDFAVFLLDYINENDLSMLIKSSLKPFMNEDDSYGEISEVLHNLMEEENLKNLIKKYRPNLLEELKKAPSTDMKEILHKLLTNNPEPLKSIVNEIGTYESI